MRRLKGLLRGVTAVAVIGVLAVVGPLPAAHALVTLGNGIYDVHVQEPADLGQTGSWNAVTGASHPTGAGRDLLFHGLTTVTNFSSLRVYGVAGTTTYTFGGAGGGTSLDPLFVSQGASVYGPAGQALSQTWSITPHSLTLTQDLIVVGTTYASSAIYHTVAITNTGVAPVSVGWRNLYDWAVNDPGFDDGPSNSIEIFGGGVVVPTTTFEFAYTPTAGSFARVAAAPPPGGGATYEPLLGLGYDPGFIGALPVTMPEEYDYVSWPSSFGTAFDYTLGGGDVTGDSAGLSYFGRTPGSALVVGPGGTLRLTQTIYAVPPGEEPGGGTVPVPPTALLLGLGVAGLGVLRRLFRRA